MQWTYLEEWKTLVSVTPKRLVIAYAVSPDAEEAGISLPPLPLWLVAGTCSLIGLVMGVSFTYHHAACLSKNEPFHPDMENLYNRQYGFIHEDNVLMTNHLIVPPEFAALREAFDTILRQGPNN